ncbi:MAG: sugar phosphate isomerase/epimerase [Planctomycetes bacterium]|nr:sugar phosphate isomerase/epimerase [Planctomycetota bacterium]
MKIGILFQNFWKDDRLAEVLPIIRSLGFDGVQLYVTKTFGPDSLSGTGIKDVRSALERNGLLLSATCADFGKGFANPDTADWSLEKVTPCLAHSRKLGTDVVTTHFGRVPEEPSARKAMVEIVTEAADRAVAAGVRLATETGSESPSDLAAFLNELDHPGLAANYDPSNLTRRGWNAVHGVGDLAGRILHTHAKDGLASGEEAPLGKGDVMWPEYIAALDAVGFDGFLTVEREHMADTPEAEAEYAAAFLKALL